MPFCGSRTVCGFPVSTLYSVIFPSWDPDITYLSQGEKATVHAERKCVNTNEISIIDNKFHTKHRTQGHLVQQLSRFSLPETQG